MFYYQRKKTLLQRPADGLISSPTLKKLLLRNLHFYRLFLTTYLSKVFSNLKKPLLKSRPYLPDKSSSKSIVIFNPIQGGISLSINHFINHFLLESIYFQASNLSFSLSFISLYFRKNSLQSSIFSSIFNPIFFYL